MPNPEERPLSSTTELLDSLRHGLDTAQQLILQLNGLVAHLDSLERLLRARLEEPTDAP